VRIVLNHSEFWKAQRIVCDSFKLKKHSQLFIATSNKPLAVVAMRVNAVLRR
jgi:hypothetical protein